MTIQAYFTPDEWDLLVGGPALTALVIIHADQVSPREAARQLSVAIAAIGEMSIQGAPGDLIQAVTGAVQAGQSPRWPAEYPRDLADVGGWALERCRHLAAVLAQRAPEAAAAAYSSWLIQIGQRVALVPGNLALVDTCAALSGERQRAALDLLARIFDVPSGAEGMSALPDQGWVSLP